MFLNFCSFNLFRPSLSSSYFSQIFKCFLPLSTLSYFSQLFYTVQPFSLLHLFKWFYFFVCFVMLFLQFSMFWTTRVCIFCFFPHVSKVFDVFPFITLFLHVFTVLASLDLFTLLSHFFHHIFLQFSSRPSHTFSRFLEVYFICYSFPLKRVSKLSTLKTVEKILRLWRKYNKNCAKNVVIVFNVEKKKKRKF